MENVEKFRKPSFFLKAFGLVQGVPVLKYPFFKLMYALLARGTRDKQAIGFMNYGYSSDEFDKTVVLKEEDEADRYSIQLYEYALRNADLKGQQVVEVGSGRGGGVSYMARYKNPSHITGVDFAKTQVKYCQRIYNIENLSFAFGNAMSLPLAAEQYDAVINVESSHCYPDLKRFYCEVFRILRKNGTFHYSDFIPVGSTESPSNVLHVIQEKLESVGFEILSVEDITENVVNSLLKTDGSKKDFFADDLSSATLSTTLHDLLATKDSESFRLFRDRVSIYYSICARKP